MTLPFDFNDAEFQDDLYANLAVLRREDPVHRSRFKDQARYHLLRHDDVSAAFRDPRFRACRPPEPIFDALVASGDADLEALGRTMRHIPVMLNAPDHTRLRRLVQKAFTPRSVCALRTRVQRLVDELLDEPARAGGMDLIADFAVPLPVVVIAEMLGVPASERGPLKTWSDDFAPVLDRTLNAEYLKRTASAAAGFGALFRSLIAQRRSEPRDDLVSALVAARDSDDALNEDEIVSTCTFLVVAGHETTTNLIGNGVYALLHHPEQLRRLRAEPALVPLAVEEIARFEAPVQRVPRLTGCDVHLRGRCIPEGNVVDLVVSSANRDPQAFHDPDQLDVGRRDNPHVAFGRGAHFCLGAALARLEGQVALQALLERFPALGLATDAVEWRRGSLLRGLRALPLSL